MPTVHTWKTNATGLIYDPADYTDGTAFVAGDTLVFSDGTPEGANGTLSGGLYEATPSGNPTALYFDNVTVAAGAILSVSGPRALNWAGQGALVNNGLLSLGTSSSPGTVIYDLLDNSASSTVGGGTFTNNSAISVADGSTFTLVEGVSTLGNFVNAAPGLLTIRGGSTFNGIGESNPNARPTFENDGRIDVLGAAGVATSFHPPATYNGAGLLAVLGAAGDTRSDTTATFYGNTTGTFDVSSGELLFNSDYSTGPNVAVNFLDGNGVVSDAISEAFGNAAAAQTGHPLQATVSGFVAGDAIQYSVVSAAGGPSLPHSMAYDPASHVLTLTLDTGQVSHLTFNGNYTLSDFQVASSYNVVTLTTTSTANALPAAPAQRVDGTAGDDTFTDSPGSQAYVGNGGHDTLAINEGRRGDVFTLQGNGSLLISHNGQLDAALGLADIGFIDGRMVFDPSDPAAAVTRLYQAALGRTPDQAGLHFWVGALQNGGALADLAAGFLSTPEFAARFGSTLSSAAFVTAIYRNVLGRAPDAAGQAFWQGLLDSSQASQGQVLAGISESAENRAATQPLVANGIWDVSETASEVGRLYDTALGRLPDAGGLAYWTTAINHGAALVDLANSFVASAEFQVTYGSLGNSGFVTAVYGNTLHRPADAAGVSYWTGVLNAGASRAQVVVGFSESAEHKQNTAANIMSNDPTQYGIKLAG